MVGAFLLAFNYSFGPVAARMHWQGKREELQALLTRSTSTVLALCGVVAVGVLLLGRPILGLFGPEFEAGYATLAVLVAAQLANAVWGPVNLLLTATGHERVAAVVLGVAAAAAVNVPLNIVLVSAFGIKGAAIGTCVCTIGWNRAMASVVSARLGLRVFDPIGAMRLGQARHRVAHPARERRGEHGSREHSPSLGSICRGSKLKPLAIHRNALGFVSGGSLGSAAE